MKNIAVYATALLAPLGVAARGLPKSRITEADDTVPQLTRITAIILQPPAVECWEVSETTSVSTTARGRKGSKGGASRMSLGTNEESDLEDVNLLAWGPHGDIFDSLGGGEYRANAFFTGYSFFKVLSGIVSIESAINITTSKGGAHAQADDNYEAVFTLEGGDDWFYFEDCYSHGTCEDTADDDDDIVPLTIQSESSGNTQMLQIVHNSRPAHRKVHDGPCSYTGVRTPPVTKGPKASGNNGAHIDVSFNIQEL